MKAKSKRGRSADTWIRRMVALILAGNLFALAVEGAWAALDSPVQSEPFYTQSYPYVFFHNMAGFGIYPYDWPTLHFLAAFDNVWSGNEFALPAAWVDYLHTHNSRHRSLYFYEALPAVHFVAGKNSPQGFEGWKTSFLDDHRTEFYTINPLTVASGFTEFAPGRYAPDSGFLDYFINYGRDGVTEFLSNQYFDVKATGWGYDGVFFDLAGSAFMSAAEIQDPANPAVLLDALLQYDSLSAQRSDPAKSYDENAALFCRDLKSHAEQTLASFPIFLNQAFRSGDPVSGANEYYKYVDVDLDESTFTTWLNPVGWKQGVDVWVDGVLHTAANPVETRIKPFFDGLPDLEQMSEQSAYALANYSNSVNAVVLNYLRPYYEPVAGGYEARVDREAIYYGYAAGKVTGIPSFNWDFFDTFLNLTGVPGGPVSTELPVQGYFKWAQDSIYFLDLGDYSDTAYETLDLGGGRIAVLRFFEHGFVIVNASSPAQDIDVDLSGHPLLRIQADGVASYYDHFSATSLPASTTSFSVPAAIRPLEGVLANSARVWSYVGADGELFPGPDAASCAAQPLVSCIEAERAKLSYQETAPGREKMKLKWRKLSTASSTQDFGDPVGGSTSLAICLYDDQGTLVQDFVVDRGGEQCLGKACWRAKGNRGLGYKDRQGSSAGLTRIDYVGGNAGRGKAAAVGANHLSKALQSLPSGVAAALSGNSLPVMQLVTSNGLCVSATVAAVRDTGLNYQARKP